MIEIWMEKHKNDEKGWVGEWWRLFTSPPIFPSFMWPCLYFSNRHHPPIQPFASFLCFSFHISIICMSLFVVFHPYIQHFPPTFTLFHPCGHLSCGYLSISPTDTVRLSIHFYRLSTFLSVFQSFKWLFLYFFGWYHPYFRPFLSSLHFSIHIPIFHVTIFVLLRSAPPIYPSIFTVFSLFYPYFSLSIGTFCITPAGVINIPIHSRRPWMSPSISPSFMWPYFYFSSWGHSSIDPFSPC